MEFFVAGIPKAQGSKRHVGRGRMIEMSKDLGPWREAIAWEAKRVAGSKKFEGPIWGHFAFFFPRPRSHYGTGRNAERLKESAPIVHSGPPDLDKLVRAACDALTMSGVIEDDRKFVEILATKKYGVPGALISIRDPAVKTTFGKDKP